MNKSEESSPEKLKTDRAILAEMQSQMTGTPTLARAMEHKARTSVTDPETGAPLPICRTPAEALRPYSIGLELYFLLLKQLSILLFVMSLVSIWPMVENYQGDIITIQGAFDVSAVLSVANLQREEDAFFANWAGNILYTCIVLLALPCFQLQATLRIRKSAQDETQLRDYAIQVTGLPRERLDRAEVQAHFEQFGEIYEVYLARAYNDLLFDYKARASNKFKALREFNLLEAKGKRPEEHRSYLKYLDRIEKFDAKIVKKNKFLKKHEELPVVRAYVVFKTHQAKAACLKVYKKYRWCGCNCLRKSLRFRNQYKLRVSHPPDPSNILYENLEVSNCSRYLRLLVSIVILGVILLVSAALIIQVKTADDDLPVCEDLDEYKVSYEEAQEYDGDTLFCWCREQSTDDLINNSDIRNHCEDYIADVTESTLLRVFSILGIFLGNFFMKMIIRRLIKFERLNSHSKAQRKYMTRTFIATFVNTGLVILLINADFGKSVELLSVTLFNGSFTEFSRQWYIKVGVLYSLILVTAVFLPHFLTLLVQWPLNSCQRACCWRCYKTQYELNKAIEGPEFNMAGRAAQVLLLVMLMFVFSGGLPVFIPLTFLAVFAIYWADKILVLRLYKRPDHYSPRLYNSFINYLYLATFVHCLVSIYMYSEPNLFPVSSSDSLLGRALDSDPAIYLLLAGAATLATYILSWLILKSCRACMKRLHMEVHHKEFKPIEAVLQQILARGVESYDVEFNPKYAEYVDAMNGAAAYQYKDVNSPVFRPRPTPKVSPETFIEDRPQPTFIDPKDL